MTSQPAVQLNALRKSYGNVEALRGLDLTVNEGEIFGFLGPNGSGKTTTIRCMLDLIRPSGGSIRLLGIDPQQDPVAVRRETGYLPGELRLNDNLTAEQTLQYLAGLRGNRLDWDFARQLSDRLELDLSRPIRQFSKGNKQKVGVVQALMHRPKLLLLDEPTSGLDPLVQQKVLRMVEEARAAGATVFFSSHILSEVQAIADRVGIIRIGEIVEIAETDSLIDRSFRRALVRFAVPTDSSALADLPGVELLSRTETTAHVQVEGQMDSLIKALAHFDVQDFETERPSLEEIFLTYYEGGAPKQASIRS
ncbi:MAG: ABC transporter ATP-binding protein [Anaerolineales bacterium]|nr:ABC transporter ATP-binding protein [Anaerolineales bacterium]